MDLYEAIRKRRSIRAYATRAIPSDALERVKQALRAAPSACNLQPWHFIFVTDAALRREIAHIANRQLWMADAPVTVVACGFPTRAYQTMGGHSNSAEIDVAIALDHLTLAAVAEGLGTCWIGAFDEAGIKKLLDVPAAARVVALIPLGYPASPGMNHPLDDGQRKPPAEIFSRDRFGNAM